LELVDQTPVVDIEAKRPCRGKQIGAIEEQRDPVKNR